MDISDMKLSLFDEFENIIVLDTETTGINAKTEEIIELAMLSLRTTADGFEINGEYDKFIKLSPGKLLPPEITKLTGISPEMIDAYGVSKEDAGKALSEALKNDKTLLVAYNAQFDMCFLYFFLYRLGLSESLKGVKMLDAMTVYKDRRAYPHKLCNAIEEYKVEAVNSHRAIDDTKAAFLLLCAMAEEKDDLLSYINLFGYNKKYGVSGPRISSVRYLPQGFEPGIPLYEQI